jgi:hypothetical protein
MSVSFRNWHHPILFVTGWSIIQAFVFGPNRFRFLDENPWVNRMPINFDFSPTL